MQAMPVAPSTLEGTVASSNPSPREDISEEINEQSFSTSHSDTSGEQDPMFEGILPPPSPPFGDRPVGGRGHWSDADLQPPPYYYQGSPPHLQYPGTPYGRRPFPPRPMVPPAYGPMEAVPYYPPAYYYPTQRFPRDFPPASHPMPYGDGALPYGPPMTRPGYPPQPIRSMPPATWNGPYSPPYSMYQPVDESAWYGAPENAYGAPGWQPHSPPDNQPSPKAMPRGGDRTTEWPTSTEHSPRSDQASISPRSEEATVTDTVAYGRKQSSPPSSLPEPRRQEFPSPPPQFPQQHPLPHPTDPQMVKKQVLGILNRISPATYPQLLDKLLHLADGMEGEVQTEMLNQIATSIHKQAITVPLHGQLYADVCAALHSCEQQRLASGQSGKRVAFRRALLNACQEFFEHPPSLPANFEELPKDQQMEKEEKLKKQKLGNIQLIAELFKRGLLSEVLIRLVIQKLLWGNKSIKHYQPSFLEVAMACNLLDSIGPLLTNERAVNHYFRRLAQLREISEPRMKFRIQDTVERWEKTWKKAPEVLTITA